MAGDPFQLDAERLEAYLSAHVDGYAGPTTITRFSGGQSNPTYLLETPARAYVLRKKPPGDLLPSAHAVEREYRVMTALGGDGFPVPKTYHLCEDETVVGTPFFLMERLDGRIFWDNTLPDLTAEDRAAMFDNAVDTLARLHAFDYRAGGLVDFGKEGAYVARQVKRWTKQYRASETETIPAMDALIDWLPTAMPDTDETSVVHGDFRFDNCIVHPTEPRILGVIDWELSTLGDPRADFCYFLMLWELPEDLRAGLYGAAGQTPGVPSREAVVERYCKASGRDALPGVDFYLAFNCFRFAAILQGVKKRGLDGNASSSEALEKGAAAVPMAEIGWRIAKRAGA